MFRRPAGGDADPAKIAEPLLRLQEHRHLLDGEARIEWLLREDPVRKQGRDVLGTCYGPPTVQGALKPLFDWMLGWFFGGDEPIDFLIVLDALYWEEASDRQREILVFHELLHAVQAKDKFGAPRYDKDSGRPVWGIRGHDVEDFVEVVARYGAHNEDLKAFKAALVGAD